MTKSIRTVLTPLLIINYASGLNIIEFPVGNPRIWFSLLYMLLFWLIYYFLLKSIPQQYIAEYFLLGVLLDILITLVSIAFAVYYDKKFRNCLRKLDIIDNTLLNIGMTTDYHRLYKKTMCLILGWFLMISLMTYGTAYFSKIKYGHSMLIATCAMFVRKYCSYINIINDLIIASILGYIGLKFDEVNQHLLNLAKDNKRRTKPRNSSLYQRRSSSQPSNNEWMTWTVIHLHLELRKISCEIDSIFGVQMTFKMGCYFCWLAIDLREIFGVILVNNYITSNKTLYAIIMLIWLCHNILKLFFLNYVCEAVSTKANATANLMKKISYSTYDIEIRENISLFLLQITQAPVRFCGMGLFQFGYKFLYGFSSLITTVVVLLIQAIMNKQTFLKNN